MMAKKKAKKEETEKPGEETSGETKAEKKEPEKEKTSEKKPAEDKEEKPVKKKEGSGEKEKDEKQEKSETRKPEKTSPGKEDKAEKPESGKTSLEKTPMPSASAREKKESAQSTNKMIIGLVLAAVVIALIMYQQGYSSTTSMSSTTTTLAGMPGDAVGQTTEKTMVAPGDAVLVNYVGYLENGSVFDTSYEDVAKKEGVYQAVREYGAMPVKLGSGSIIDGFEESLIGMKKGETKRVTLPPEKAYGERTDELIEDVPRVQTSPRIQNVTVEKFKTDIGKEPYEGLNFTVPNDGDPSKVSWPMQVLSVEDEMVTFRYDPPGNATIETIFGTAQVKVNETDILIRMNPELGDFMTLSGPATVIDYNENNITVDFNYELAGETLIFDIKVEDIQ